jgi:hypothetical protein
VGRDHDRDRRRKALVPGVVELHRVSLDLAAGLVRAVFQSAGLGELLRTLRRAMSM